MITPMTFTLTTQHPIGATKLFALLLGGALLGGAAGCRDGDAAAAPAQPPQNVAFVTVAPEQVALASVWLATLDGMVNAQIRPQVSGYLVRQVRRAAGHPRAVVARAAAWHAGAPGTQGGRPVRAYGRLHLP